MIDAALMALAASAAKLVAKEISPDLVKELLAHATARATRPLAKAAPRKRTKKKGERVETVDLDSDFDITRPPDGRTELDLPDPIESLPYTAPEIFRASPRDAWLGALALAISPEAVFSDARRRMGLVFRINLGVAIALAVILLGGLAGSVYSAVFLRDNIWATVFGGVSAADVVGLWVFKPLTAVNSALIGTQRLELLQLRLHQQLASCSQHPKLEERIECQTVVWDTIQKELSIMAGVPSRSPKATKHRSW